MGSELVSFSSFFFVLGRHGDVKNSVVCDGGYFFRFPGLLYISFVSSLVFPVEAVPAQLVALGS